MPLRPYRLCERCSAMTRDRFCAEHGPRRRRPAKSAHQRGYGRDWRKAREAYLQADAQHRLCWACLFNEKVALMSDLHHVIPLREGGTHDWTNLRSLCKSHHMWITQIETRGGWEAAARALRNPLPLEEIGR